jgi:hypothetical protein
MTGNSAGQGGAGGHGGGATPGFANQGFFGGGGGGGGAGGAGGGIYNAGSAATLTVTDSTISTSASGTGGVGGAGGSPIGMCGCDPGFGGAGGAGGSGGADGGGVANSMGTVVMARSALFSNVAGSGGSGGGGAPGSGLRGGPGFGGPGGLGSSGGGIRSNGGSLSATNSTLYSNGAGGGGAGGAGAFNGGRGGSGGSGGDGGAIAVTNGASSLLNVTADADQAGPGANGGSTGGSSGVNGLGGGLYVQSASSGDDLVLQNTIVAASSRGANCAGSSSSAITDAGHDLSFPDATCPGINGDPKLLSLKNYGGPTMTLALAPGSAAIDQVPATGAGCPATDERGVKRPQGSACDIGAFEFATPQITITSPADGASYTLGSTVLAAYRCSEGGVTTPIASRKGTVANGQPIDTSSTGTKPFTVTATDKAGNQTTKTVTYKITA